MISLSRVKKKLSSIRQESESRTVWEWSCSLRVVFVGRNRSELVAAKLINAIINETSGASGTGAPRRVRLPHWVSRLLTLDRQLLAFRGVKCNAILIALRTWHWRFGLSVSAFPLLSRPLLCRLALYRFRSANYPSTWAWNREPSEKSIGAPEIVGARRKAASVLVVSVFRSIGLFAEFICFIRDNTMEVKIFENPKRFLCMCFVLYSFFFLYFFFF